VDHTPTRNAGQTKYDIEAYVMHPGGATGTIIHAELFQSIGNEFPKWGDLHVATTYRTVGFDNNLNYKLKAESSPLPVPVPNPTCRGTEEDCWCRLHRRAC
jgi:hypothetical protein